MSFDEESTQSSRTKYASVLVQINFCKWTSIACSLMHVYSTDHVCQKYGQTQPADEIAPGRQYLSSKIDIPRCHEKKAIEKYQESSCKETVLQCFIRT